MNFRSQIIQLYDAQPFYWGAVDLVAAGEAGSLVRTAESAAVLRSAAGPEGPVFSRIQVYWPSADEEVLQRWRREFTDAWARSRPQASKRDGEQTVDLVHIAAPPGLEIASLVRLVRDLPARTAVVIARASVYRSAIPDPPLPQPAMPGDSWARHVHTLMVDLQDGAEAARHYFMLDLGELLPARTEFRDLLFSVNPSAVLGTEVDSAEREILALYHRWEEWALHGDVDRALQELEETEPLSEDQRIYIRIRLFDRAGVPQAVVAELRRHREALLRLEPRAALQVARIAETSDEDQLAMQLLSVAMPELTRREDLELALTVAHGLGEHDLEGEVGALVKQLFPASGVLVRWRAVKLAQAGKFTEAAEVLSHDDDPESAGRAELLAFLGERLAEPAEGDAVTLIEAVRSRFPNQIDAAATLLAEHLQRERRGDEALDLLMAGRDGDPLNPDRASRILSIVRGMALRGAMPGGERLLAALKEVVRCLALRPDDGNLRLALIRTLSPEVLGSTGIAAGAAAMLSLASEALTILPPSREAARRLPSEDDLLGLVKRGFSWLAEQPVVALEVLRFPPGLLHMPADEAMAGLGEFSFTLTSEEEALKTLELVLALVVAIAPLSSRPEQDLIIVRGVLMRLVQTGRVQLGRDWAEQALRIAGDDRRRIHLAWHCYAETYARGGNLEEGMIGISCALAASPERTAEEAWEESTCMFRILRDLGLREEAREVLGRGRMLIPALSHEARASARMDTLELQLDLLASAEVGRADAVRPRELIDRAAKNLRTVLALQDEVAPAAALLAATMDISESAILEVPPDYSALLEEARTRVDDASRPLLDVVTARGATASHLANLAARLQPARYAEDAGYDVLRFVKLARRLLGSPEATRPASVIYATEVLADHAIPLPEEGQDNIPRLIESAQAPAEAAQSLSQHGIAVVTLGLTQERLVRVTTADGRHGDVVVEDPSTFSVEHLRKWRREYPYRYGAVQNSHVFYTTTQAIGVGDLPQRGVVVASTDLQTFPLNLLQVGGDLAGWTHRLAAVPSLTWLLSIRRRQADTYAPPAAWIPQAETEGPFDTLTILADRLRDTLDQFGISLFGDSTVAEELAASELAIVGAHGGVDATKQFFRVVADDGNLAMPPAALAKSLRGAGIVVLFVCSAGRRDLHPGASAVLGLAKDLLSNGCRTVVAPPWPLDVGVPPRWLPAFLKAWADGETVLDSSFVANQAVTIHLGAEPAKSLAMSVYGDPFTKKSSGTK